MRRLLETALLLLALAPGAGRAESSKTLLMVDASSSMLKTDPRQLRKVAAELFVDLASQGDLVAVAEFDATARYLSNGFEKVTDAASRGRLKTAVRAIRSDGQWTDFGAAFGAAAEAFQGPPPKDEKRLLVFLTDGRCDPAPDERSYLKKGERLADYIALGKYEREIRCQRAVLAALSGAFSGVQVVAVGLSKAAPADFLELVAKRSGGRSMVTERAEDLPLVFAELQAFNAGAQVIKGTVFKVDEMAVSLDVVTVVRGAKVELVAPDETPLADGPGAYAVRAEQYTVMHVDKPKGGEWTATSRSGLPKDGVVGIIKFKFHLSLESPPAVVVGEKVKARALLTAGVGEGRDPGKVFLERHKFYLDLIQPDAGVSSTEMAATPDGWRSASFPTAEPGTLEVLARVEPGPQGALSRQTPARAVAVVPPFRGELAPLEVGALKAGERVERVIEMAQVKAIEHLEVSVKPVINGAPLNVSPERLTFSAEAKTAKVTFTVWDEAPAGPFAGILALEAVTEPHTTAEPLRVPLKGSVLAPPLLEAHGGKLLGGALLVLALAGGGVAWTRKRRQSG